MTAPEDFRDGIEVLESEVVQDALHRNGWQRTGGREGLYDRFVNDEIPNESLLIPLDASRPDYPELMADALRALSSHPVRASSLVLQQLAPTPGDEVRFCKEVATVRGSIPWTLGEELFRSAGSALKASAKATIERRPNFGNANYFIANDFMQAVRMGQTQIGSFVVTAYTPPDREFFEKESQKKEVLRGGTGAHTGRDVVALMRDVLSITREALDEADRTDRIEQFDEAVQYGLSKEMASALGGLVNQSDGAAVSIDLGRTVDRGSTERPDQSALYELSELAPSRRAARTEVEFFPQDYPILQKVVLRLGSPVEVEEVTVTGTVEVLTRQVGKLGVIVLNVRSGSPASKMRVQLPIREYEAALEAHRRERIVRLSGRQERQGNYFWLREPSRLMTLGSASGKQEELGEE